MAAATNATDGGTKKSRGGSKSPYFLQPAKSGQVAVLRRPCGNRAAPKVCGVMNTRAQALALVKQLTRAETAVDDLFLEATDDGIEALEAVLEACRASVLARDLAGNGAAAQNGQASASRKTGRRRRGRRSSNGRVEGGEAA
ncbi:MAG TPA: hypothetical protein VEA99_12555 [Gemmatimonadaceae bacterium]|nr:hypothetical protein [Gemmatimonadaceae bacterium]